MIPSNYTEKEVIDIIDDVSNKLAFKFKFGYHEIDDIKQQAFIFAWEALPRYDGKRPLANFLYIHIKNRLINYKRDNYERLEKPCNKCPLKAYMKKEDKCLEFNKFEDCKLYSEWLQRNHAKKCLMHNDNLEGDLTPSHRQIGNGEYDLRDKELDDYINVNLPVEYRMDYLKLKGGHKLNPQRREFIENLLLELLQKGGYVEA